MALMAGTALVAGPVGRLADRSRRRAVMAAMGDPKWRRTENNAIWVDQHELEAAPLLEDGLIVEVQRQAGMRRKRGGGG